MCQPFVGAVSVVCKASANDRTVKVVDFSHGVQLLVALQRAGRIDVPPLKFAWIQSARLPRDPSCAGLFDTPISTPCLVNYNEDDQSVAPDEVRQPPRIQPPEEGPTCLLLLGPT